MTSLKTGKVDERWSLLEIDPSEKSNHIMGLREPTRCFQGKEVGGHPNQDPCNPIDIIHTFTRNPCLIERVNLEIPLRPGRCSVLGSKPTVITVPVTRKARLLPCSPTRTSTGQWMPMGCLERYLMLWTKRDERLKKRMKSTEIGSTLQMAPNNPIWRV